MKPGEIFMPSFKVHSHCGNNSLILVYFSVTTNNRSTFTFCRCNLNKKHVFRCKNVAVTKEIALAVTVNEPFREKLCFYTCLWCCSQGVSVQGGLCPRRCLSRGVVCPEGSLSVRHPRTVKKRAECILLECILVYYANHPIAVWSLMYKLMCKLFTVFWVFLHSIGTLIFI